MIKYVSLAETYLQDLNFREQAKKEYQLTNKNIEKIKKIYLKKIMYPDYKEAYDYVDNLFPRVNVKEVVIYKVSSKDLAKMGYGGAEGFYHRVSKVVVVCGTRGNTQPIDKRFMVKAKIERDEVIVHELCHYCYAFEGQSSVSREMVEEFAYGYSVGYLRQKGYTDEQIVKYNFLPYLVNVSCDKARNNVMAQNNVSTYEYNNHTRFQRKEFNRKYGVKIFNRAKEIAMERGLRLIDMYSKKIDEGTVFIDEEEDIGRFDILDL